MDRKSLRQEYKQREPARGAFAWRCLVSQRVWVSASANLDAAKNGLVFMLRSGQHRDAALQAEWNTHGEAAFQFEVLEALDADTPSFSVADLLKEKKRDWTARLGAATLLP